MPLQWGQQPVVEKKKCNPTGCGGHLCIRVCPINRTGDECIVKECLFQYLPGDPAAPQEGDDISHEGETRTVEVKWYFKGVSGAVYENQ